jgi:hypothetical protein
LLLAAHTYSKSLLKDDTIGGTCISDGKDKCVQIFGGEIPTVILKEKESCKYKVEEIKRFHHELQFAYMERDNTNKTMHRNTVSSTTAKT